MKAQLPDSGITFTDGKVTSYNDLLLIDDTNLSAEFSQHAAWLGYIGVLTAEAEADYEVAKLEADTVEAEADYQARLSLNSKGIKFTEPMVKAWIAMDTSYINANTTKIEKLKVYKTMKALETAMKEKGSMLISLGATQRQEMDVTNLVSRIRKD